MRLARLSLEKYGHFENCTLQFERSPTDFHLVFGANEAGKSTTMSAVRDLLFGFPHAKAYHFLFDTTLQRVGATLDTAQGRLSVKRRRTRHGRDSLVDDTDAAVPDAPLLAALHGLSREAFELNFSLDHARLRAGGRAIVDAKDDVGLTLFEAAHGLSNAQALLGKLQAEADAIWGERRAQGKTFWQAERQKTEAEERLKSARVLPKAWLAARDRLAQLQQSQAELEAERSRLQIGLDKIQRIRRLAGPVAQRAAALTAAGEAAPVFDTSHEALHAQVSLIVAEAEIELATASSACQAADATRRSIAPNRKLLDHREAVDALVKAAGAAAKAEDDLPALHLEMAALQADVDRLSREVGLAAASLDALLSSLPPTPLLASLQAKATSLQDLQTRLEEARDQVQRDRATRARAASSLAGNPAPQSARDLAAALSDGQTALAVLGRQKERQRAVAEAETAMRRALDRLAPWAGSPEALAALVPPGDEEARAAGSALADTAKSAAAAQTALRDANDRSERLDLEMRQVASCRKAVSAREVAQARSARGQGWAGLRTSLISGLPAPEAILADYEGLVSAADLLADRRFDTAEASARLMALAEALELAGLDARHAQQRLDSEAAALAARRTGWQARLSACKVPALEPEPFRQWAADRLDALHSLANLAQARQTQADEMASIEGARLRLLAAHGGAIRPDAILPDILASAQALADAQSAGAERHAAAQAAAATADNAVMASEARLADREARLEAWHAEWTRAVTGSGLPIDPGTLPALLPLFGQLRSTLDAAIKQQRRIAGIDRDQTRFGAEALHLAASCGFTDDALDPDRLIETLRLALQTALQDERAASEADAALAKWGASKDKARRVIEAAHCKLAPLLALADLPDQAALGPAIEAARALRTAWQQLHVVNQSILAGGEGASLEALVEEVDAADLDTLPAAAAAARATIGELDTRIAATAQEVGQAHAAFATLDRGGDAALAAADEHQARAAMAGEAESYLMKRTQAVMLKWAVDEYRRRQEHPLLTRASTLFSTLTLGRYDKLDIDRTSDRPRLVGHCADGRSLVGVDGMSDGTADQLFLALRLAALEQSLDAGVVLPFLADDLFINFDDRRAHAGFRVLGELSRRTQVLFFTHHDHLRAIAQDALGPHTVPVCDLADAA